LNCRIGGDEIFYDDENLTTMTLIGGIHNKTVASLHLRSWRNEMKDESTASIKFYPPLLIQQKRIRSSNTAMDGSDLLFNESSIAKWNAKHY